jgi:hypothetical protein
MAPCFPRSLQTWNHRPDGFDTGQIRELARCDQKGSTTLRVVDISSTNPIADHKLAFLVDI